MAEEVVKVQPDALKKGAYCFIRGMPCRIAELEHLPKATANGNKRLRLRGPHAFTGKVYGGDVGWENERRHLKGEQYYA